MIFKKYPSIERLGHEDTKDLFKFQEDTLVIEEKVDGGNGVFWWEKKDNVIHFGSRNRDLTEEQDDKIFAKQQISLKELLKNNYKKGIKLNLDYVYYIEWMAIHTIRYTNIPDFIGLDIRLKHQANAEGFGMFLGRDLREQEFKRLNIENIPIVWRGKVRDFKKIEVGSLIKKSKYYDGKMEGIVIKNYCRKHPRGNHQLYSKFVTDEFKENNKAVFGSVRQEVSDTSKVVDEFVTDARVRKQILKLTKEFNEKLEMSLMHKLPNLVIKDILKEEFSEIYDKYKFIDFKEFRQKATKRCLKVLNEEIQKNIK